jgi:dTDP-4-dehydrorhamnose reductase
MVSSKIIVLGNGFVASHLPYEVARYYLIPSKDDIQRFFNRYKPDVIINCIGSTGRPNIDYCETHQQETYLANTVIPLLLADMCKDIYMVHLSSGCCFYGSSPQEGGWQEKDYAHPVSYYSRTKYATDLLLGQLSNVVSLRLRMPISEKDSSRNLINKLRGYRQVIDIPNSMTFMTDLVKVIDWAIKNRPTGIYHVANPQPLTASQIMKEYQKHVPEHQFEVITEEQLDGLTTAKRSNCILNTDKLTKAGFIMSNSHETLTTCMTNYLLNIERNKPCPITI